MATTQLATSVQQVEYALGHTSRELDRLSVQAALLEPFTRQLFHEAGILPGMRVLDVGCGSGDVSLLAAEIVGDYGAVVGVDRSPDAISRASARAFLRNRSNVTFERGDLSTISFDEPFDAIVGRFVLMYQSDPIASLKNLYRYLRPGGLMVFQEMDATSCRSYPLVPIYEDLIGWVRAALKGTGARPEFGLELPSAFAAVGLPRPKMRIDSLLAGEPESTVYEMAAEAVRSLLPMLEKLNIVSREEVQVGTLAERLRQEVLSREAIIVLYGIAGAYSRKHNSANSRAIV
ncbi:MAG TPA: class I SAM-dependent methyltransferase [Terriglobales bacterium]|jgi:SAM-dependent methyltransferase